MPSSEGYLSREPTTIGANMVALLQTLESYGVERSQFASSAGLDLSALEDPTTRIDMTTWRRAASDVSATAGHGV